MTILEALVKSGAMHRRITLKRRKRSLGGRLRIPCASSQNEHVPWKPKQRNRSGNAGKRCSKATRDFRVRDAASQLGVGEAQLLATGCAGGRVIRLDGDWSQLIRQFPLLGRVMCLTRNEHAVHERYGEFREVDFFNGIGQVVGPDIDLRLFMLTWRFGFAVTDPTPDGERQSFQFFDAGETPFTRSICRIRATLAPRAN